MDHKVSKDMISSGMIPSGEKTQADLGRTQYGSAPSPNSLFDAYKSMYEHHQKDKDGNTIPHEGEELKEENINELKTRTMLNYIDKASDSASKQLDKANKTTSRKKEVKARLKMDKRERGIEMAKDKIMKRVKTEEVDKFDIVFNHFISEGYSEKEAYSKMANLTEEQLDEFVGAVMTGLKAVGGLMAKKGLGGALKTVGAKMGSKIGGSAGRKLGYKAGSAIANNPMTSYMVARDMMPKGGGGGGQQPMMAKKTSSISASADLFDIVKGQLLDEGLSEEEIKDIMLTLTPDEIMKEMNQGPSTPVKNYGDSPDKPKILPNFGATRAKPRTTDKGTIIKGGKDTGKTPAQL